MVLWVEDEDRRQKVIDSGKSTRSLPYWHMVRLRASKLYKSCCGSGFLGTAFLLDGGEETEYCHYATAGHCLWCVKHMRYVSTVEIFSADGEFMSKIQRGEPDQPGYYELNPLYLRNIQDVSRCREHNSGVIAVRRDELKPKFIKDPFFRAVDNPPKESECYISGFPVLVPGSRSKEVTANEDLFEDHGTVTILTQYHGYPVRMLKHYMDTTGGQAGSPVFLKSDPSVLLGLHIGFGTASKSSTEPSFGVAVLLTKDRVRQMVSSFEGTCFQ